ncbi:MAG: glycosyltransferase family 39 protein [Cyanobacteria bacterium Co-bin8]|nr:glycosyltransferase family 39 protein [Cyanobacteria bacterium Co-bin8]
MNWLRQTRFKIEKAYGWLSLVVAIALVLGLFFRLAYLDNQIYWHDEAYTSLRVSGFTAQEVRDDLFTGRLVGIADVARYQHPAPGKTVVDVVRSLALEDAQHPPLYYLLARGWVQIFGSSVVALRSLSVLIGLLLFPALYWLCHELLRPGEKAAVRPLAGLTTRLALALAAVSPYHVLYAQEAREYGLWSVLTLLFSAAFLRALRLNSWSAWGLATLFLAAGLYTQPLMLMLGAASWVYLLLVNDLRLNRSVMRGSVALGLGMLAFGPWLRVIQVNQAPGTSWTAVPISLDTWLKAWGLHLQRAFLLTHEDFGFDHWTSQLSLPLLLLLVVYAGYTLYRTTPPRVWLFVAVLMACVALPLALPDLVLGGQRSLSGRYLVPFYLGLQVLVAVLLAQKLHDPRPWQRQFWRAVTALLLTLGVVSCALNTQSQTAWTKVINYRLPEVAEAINAAPQPLLVSDSFGVNFGNILALSYLLKPQVQLLLIGSPDIYHVPQIPAGFSSVFVLNPSDAFRQLLAQQQNQPVQLQFNDAHLFLWRLGDRSKIDEFERSPGTNGIH